MFRSTHKQPLLDEPATATAPSPARKATSTSFRSFFFGKDEPYEQHHDADEPQSPADVGTATHRSHSQPSNKIAPMGPPQKPNPRDTFQRTKSHPIRLDASAALSASRTFDPSMSRAAALDVGSLQPVTPRKEQQQQQQQLRPTPRQSPTNVGAEPPSLRSTVYGSCVHVLSTVISVIVQQIKTHREYSHATTPLGGDTPPSPVDNNTVRKAKLLYIALLEKAQKERGEWQGFSADALNKVTTNHTEEEHQNDSSPPDESANGLLTASLNDSSKEDTFTILNELLELSFRNLRVAIVPPDVFTTHRSTLSTQSLACPVSLDTLLLVGKFVSELSRDEKGCLLHLLSLWCALCIVNPDRHDLKQIIEEKHMLVLSESSDIEFMQHSARRSTWPDPLAIDLLLVMAHYREIIFSDLEFYRVRQEMQIPLKFSVPEPIDEGNEAASAQTDEVPETDKAGDAFALEDEAPASPETTDSTDDTTAAELASNGHDEDHGGQAADPVVSPSKVTVAAQNGENMVVQLSTQAAPTVPQDHCDESAEPAAMPVIVDNGHAYDMTKTSTEMLSDATAIDANAPRQSSVATEQPRSPPCPPRAQATRTKKAVQRRAVTSPSAATVRSPRAAVISPRIIRSPRIHIHTTSLAAAAKRRPRVDGNPLDMALPFVAVALAGASLGVLATVAFFSMRRASH